MVFLRVIQQKGLLGVQTPGIKLIPKPKPCDQCAFTISVSWRNFHIDIPIGELNIFNQHTQTKHMCFSINTTTKSRVHLKSLSFLAIKLHAVSGGFQEAWHEFDQRYNTSTFMNKSPTSRVVGIPFLCHLQSTLLLVWRLLVDLLPPCGDHNPFCHSWNRM